MDAAIVQSVRIQAQMCMYMNAIIADLWTACDPRTSCEAANCNTVSLLLSLLVIGFGCAEEGPAAERAKIRFVASREGPYTWDHCGIGQFV